MRSRVGKIKRFTKQKEHFEFSLNAVVMAKKIVTVTWDDKHEVVRF